MVTGHFRKQGNRQNPQSRPCGKNPRPLDGFIPQECFELLSTVYFNRHCLPQPLSRQGSAKSVVSSALIYSRCDGQPGSPSGNWDRKHSTRRGPGHDFNRTPEPHQHAQQPLQRGNPKLPAQQTDDVRLADAHTLRSVGLGQTLIVQDRRQSSNKLCLQQMALRVGHTQVGEDISGAMLNGCDSVGHVLLLRRRNASIQRACVHYTATTILTPPPPPNRPPQFPRAKRAKIL